MYEPSGTSAGTGEPPRPELLSDEVREERFQRLLREWWRDERPDWTEVDWWDLGLRDDVRGLLWLPPGPLLVAAVAEVTNPGRAAGGEAPDRASSTDPARASGGRAPAAVDESAPPWAPCQLPHAGEAMPGWPTLGHAPGWPCACQVVLAAAWEACAAWVAAGAARALVGAAGPVPVTFRPGRPSPPIDDPAREELAVALRVSPNSMGNRIVAARALVAHPELHALVQSAGISAWGARVIVLGLPACPRI